MFGLLPAARTWPVLVFALSPDSIDSRACQAELAYAVATDRHILPVTLREVKVDLAPQPIGTTHIVDYRERTSDNAISLIKSLDALAEPAAPPDPLPKPPPPPITDLAPIGEELNATSLTFEQQQDLLERLRRRINEHDQLDTLHSLLDRFEQRGDVAAAIERGVADLRDELPVIVDADRSARRRPRGERDPESVDRLRALVAQARAERLTPIVGHGANDRMIGSTRALAREWARSFEFPMAEYRHDELADVAQFIAVMTGVDTLRSSLGDYLLKHLGSQDHGDETAPAATDGVEHVEPGGEGDRAQMLTDAMNRAWRSGLTPDDPYEMLAALPCPVYVVAHPWDLMAEALRGVPGRDPVVEICRWREDVWQWPPSIFDSEPTYLPSVERPLVFHAFGALSCPDSLVITQDDFDDYQIAIAKNPAVVPTIVQRVLANSAITMLGFELDDRDVRVLMRSLIAQEGAQRLSRFTHVAVQMELTGDATSPERARRYLERYFGKIHQPSIDLFWGSVDEFSSDLAALWNQGIPR